MKIFFESGNDKKDFGYILTGEMRAPKKNEWYISGAIPKAYQAFNDLTTSYAIAKKVRVKLIPAHYIPIS